MVIIIDNRCRFVKYFLWLFVSVCDITVGMRTLTYPISEKEESLSVETFLRAQGYSKHIIIHLRNTDGLSIGGESVFTNRILRAGDCLSVCLQETESASHVAERQIPLAIVYEDEDILVINKPADLPIHPSQGNYDNTLVNGLAWYGHQVRRDPLAVYHIINRLDRDTTGLVLVAKHRLSAAVLGKAAQDREIHREYRALCCGKVSNCVIDAPIARVPGSVIERCVNFETGDPAVTHVRLLSYRKDLDLSLVALKLETGRTHQIRVHMKHMGHPLPGDFLYNPDYRLIGRQALHSYNLTFRHPITGREQRLEAPLPEDMERRS